LIKFFSGSGTSYGEGISVLLKSVLSPRLLFSGSSMTSNISKYLLSNTNAKFNQFYLRAASPASK